VLAIMRDLVETMCLLIDIDLYLKKLDKNYKN
jgi:hypothetical protein